MSDFWDNYRTSGSVQKFRPEPSRRIWLETIANAPDEYREEVGLSTDLSPITRQTARSMMFNEGYSKTDPSMPAGGWPQGPLPPGGLPFLGQVGLPSRPTFQQMNAAAVLDQDVGRMLTQGTDDVSNDALIGRALAKLGQR